MDAIHSLIDVEERLQTNQDATEAPDVLWGISRCLWSLGGLPELLVRPLVTKKTPAAGDLPRRAAELVAAAAERCDAPVATGVMPAGGRL